MSGDSRDTGRSAALVGTRLYGILDMGYVAEERAESVARDLLDGGVGLLQFRAKGWDPARISELGERLLPICRDASVPMIVNDYPDLALSLGADGLHLGQDDGSYDEARRIVGDAMILGRSTHSPEQARKALDDGFDYIGFGPLFPTPTKAGRAGIGIGDIRRVEREIGSRIPVFCIGGIKRDNLSEVLAAGAERVVIVSDLLQASSTRLAVEEARKLLS